MKKILKGLGLGFVALALSFSLATPAGAVVTLSNLAVDTAAADAFILGATNTTGTITIGSATHTGTTTISSGATTTDALDIGAAAVTTGNGVDLALAGLTEGKGLDMSDLGAITSGKAIHVDATGVTQTSGILVHVDSASTALTGAGRLLFVDHTAATGSTGIVAEFKTAATDETNVVKITSAGMIDGVNLLVEGTTGMTTGSLIKATSSSAAALATNGIISFTSTGNFTSTSAVDGGFVEVKANDTTAGTVFTLVA